MCYLLGLGLRENLIIIVVACSIIFSLWLIWPLEIRSLFSHEILQFSVGLIHKIDLLSHFYPALYLPCPASAREVTCCALDMQQSRWAEISTGRVGCILGSSLGWISGLYSTTITCNDTVLCAMRRPKWLNLWF